MSKNRYNAGEWAGAMGDLGTFIPFVVGYIAVAGMEPAGVLFSFGLVMVACGFFYQKPIPVQPMKAIGGAVIAGGAAITPGVVWGAGLFTGLFWLLVGLSGAGKIISRWVAKPVQSGIVLGLGMAFMLEGIRMMRPDLLVGIVALITALLLLDNKKVPVMFILLALGVAVTILRQPQLLQGDWLQPAWRWPVFTLAEISRQDFLRGAILLGIPQIPLTFGNAVVALTAENNRLFPEKPLTEKRIMISHGLINLISPLFGGVPLCHGAGGLAGHTRFGAKTGGALVILGTALLVLSVFFASSAAVVLGMLPQAVLGVVLFIAGLELALGTRSAVREKSDYYVMLITAAFGIVNMGAGFLAGVISHQLIARKILRLS